MQYANPPWAPKTHALHPLCNKSAPWALPPADLDLIPKGMREEAVVLFCFCLLEIINPEVSLARDFPLSAVFCLICFLSQTATQALLGFRPDPLLLGADQKTYSPGVPDIRGDLVSSTPRTYF